MLKDCSASQEVTGNTITNMCSLQRAINFTETNVRFLGLSLSLDIWKYVYIQELRQLIFLLLSIVLPEFVPNKVSQIKLSTCVSSQVYSTNCTCAILIKVHLIKLKRGLKCTSVR